MLKLLEKLVVARTRYLTRKIGRLVRQLYLGNYDVFYYFAGELAEIAEVILLEDGKTLDKVIVRTAQEEDEVDEGYYTAIMPKDEVEA